MTDGWDERTEAIPGVKVDKSFELDFDFVEAPMMPDSAGASLIVFEPAPLGLAEALQDMGFMVRVGFTGVDVMSVVAAQPPGVVVCAPSPDPERRRLLTAALRLRFPHVPVVYVSVHAGHEEAVLGAVREGARAVLPWPLPSRDEVDAVLMPFMRVATPAPPLEPRDTRELTPLVRPPALRADSQDDEPQTVITGKLLSPPIRKDARVVPTLAVPQPVSVASGRSGRPQEPPTLPSLPPMRSGGEPARRGQIGDLLASVSPFLWSLEDAANWAARLGDAGDHEAASHARTLSLLSRLLEQLQARIDDSGV